METKVNTNSFNSDEAEIDLLELFHELMQHIIPIIICTVIGAALAFGGTKLFITPTYSASSMIYILTKTTSVTSLADLQIGSQLTVDFETLAKSRPVLEGVIEELDIQYTYGQLYRMMTVSNPSKTRILKLTVNSPDPELSKEISNTWADVTADRVAYVMNTDKPKIVESAVKPSGKSSPNTLKNTLVGAIIGFILICGVIVIRFLLNDTIQTEEDIRKYLGMNTLASIPMEKRGKTVENRN